MFHQATPDYRIEAVDRVWSGHRVNFDLVETPSAHLLGYYNEQRQLTIARRERRSGLWYLRRLDCHMAWDSHSHIALGIDSRGCLHVAANMHASPLTYWRADRPGDLNSLRRLDHLVDPDHETQMTYPRFLTAPDGRLIFAYRDGVSGKGSETFLVEAPEPQRFELFAAGATLDGESRRSAYAVGPHRQADGLFHMVWVWRDSPDAASNHDLSYARSPDLRRWENAAGDPLPHPIRFSESTIADPVQVGAGMINNNTLLALDDRKRPVIAYHRFDGAGDTQIHLARADTSGRWQITCLTGWHGFRWAFSGGGALEFRLRLVSFRLSAPGLLTLLLRRDAEWLELEIDSATLALLAEQPVSPLTQRLHQDMQGLEGMERHSVVARWQGVEDAVSPGKSHGDQAQIVWATLPPHRDQARPAIPDPTTLYFALPE